ncbi:MAG: recombination mediator RecR [Thermoflexales bacterium]|nr:recombination mediator RecR [Thermoflexales bacterium]
MPSLPRSLPPSVTRLVDALSQLPGIGPKTASRLAYFLLRAPPETAASLADALRDLKARTRLCSVCLNITEADPCEICSTPSRDRGVICVVEEPLDVTALERARFGGVYHVLHGVISPMNGVGPDDLRIRELLARVAEGRDGVPVREVILATNPTLEGENTAAFIARKLSGSGARVSRLARGLPVGGDLEYADEITLSRAIEGRQNL